jgi:hypothetical protein
MSHLAPFASLSRRLGTCHLSAFQRSKTPPSTGNNPGFFETYEFFVWVEAPAYNRRLRWRAATYPILPETVYVSSEGMVFLFYGLNGAEMSQSVPFGQQAYRKRQSLVRPAGSPDLFAAGVNRTSRG